MKKILQTILFNTFGVLFCNYLWQAPIFIINLQNLLTIACLLTFFELILKPVINLLLLPINILTLGLIKIATNTLGFYFVQFFVDPFKIESIKSLPINWQGVSISSLEFQGFSAFVVLSLTLSTFISFSSFISTINKK